LHKKFWSVNLNGADLLEDQDRILLNGSVRKKIADFRLDITA
jgi:hypothetical protein